MDPRFPAADYAGTSTETISPDTLTRMQTAADNAASGVRDPESMRKAAEVMERIREAMRHRHGRAANS